MQEVVSLTRKNIYRLSPLLFTLALFIFVFSIQPFIKSAYAVDGDGLKGEYFNGTSHQGSPIKTVNENVNFNVGTGTPYPGEVPVDSYSVRWTGWIKTPDNQTGTYTFYIATDDGYRVYVDNMTTPLMARWWNVAGVEWSATKTLNGGTYYPIKIEYYENIYNSLAVLKWSGPNLAKEVIPTTVLYSSDPNATPTPSPSVTPTPAAPTVKEKAYVLCTAGTYTANAADVTWTDSGVDSVDISTAADFSSYYRKTIASGTSTVAPNDFSGAVGVSGALSMNPSTTYYVRVHNGGGYSSGASIVLEDCPGGPVKFGSWVGVASNTFGKLASFEKAVGKIPAVRHIYYSNVPDPAITPDVPAINTDYTKLDDYLAAVPLRSGEILAINWASDDITNPDTKDIAKVADGTADTYLDPFINGWADAIDASTGNSEVWINVYWEVNGCHGWNDWWCIPQGANKQTRADQFKTAYNRIVQKFKNRFAANGKTNVKFVWNVDGSYPNDIALSYPGDTHVDIASFDGYEATQTQLQNLYNKVEETAPGKHKAILETSQRYGDSTKDDQLRTFFTDLQSWAPDVRAVVWFDAPVNPSDPASFDTIVGKDYEFTQAFCDVLNYSYISTLGNANPSNCGLFPIDPPSPPATPAVTPPASGAYLGSWVGSAVNQAGSEAAYVDSTRKLLKIKHWIWTQNGSTSPLNGNAADFTTAITNNPVPDDQILMLSWAPSSSGSTLHYLNNGDHDAYIDGWANALKAYNKPVLLRLMQDDNKPGYWWHTGTSDTSTYKAYYKKGFQRVVNRFRVLAANNVSFAWCPFISNTGGAGNAAPSYPGNSYVDWVCLDGVPYANNQIDFADAFGADYTTFSDAAYAGKPLMVADIYDAHGYDPTRRDHVNAILSDIHGGLYPNIKSVVWFSENSGSPSKDITSSAYPLTLTGFKTQVRDTFYIGRVSQAPTTSLVQNATCTNGVYAEGAMNFNWSDNSVDSLQISTTSDFANYSQKDVSAITNKTTTGPEGFSNNQTFSPNTTYYVRALNGDGSSTAVAFSLGVCPPAPPPQLLIDPPASGAYYGAWIGAAVNQAADPATFETQTGKNLKIRHWYWSQSGTYAINTSASTFTSLVSSNPIPTDQYLMLSWAPAASTSTLADVNNGLQDSYIDEWATALKNWDRQVFLRLMYNDNKSGNWWFSTTSTNPNDSVKVAYKNAFQRVVNRFHNIGANKVTFVWCPWASGSASAGVASPSYPGNSYVDWICLDAFPYESGKTGFGSAFGADYTTFTGASYNSKPLMIGTTAARHSYDPTRASNTTSILNDIRNGSYPSVKAVVWFSENSGSPTNDLLSPSYPQTKTAYTNGIANSYYVGR